MNITAPDTAAKYFCSSTVESFKDSNPKLLTSRAEGYSAQKLLLLLQLHSAQRLQQQSFNPKL
jgi:hypothetical protein